MNTDMWRQYRWLLCVSVVPFSVSLFALGSSQMAAPFGDMTSYGIIIGLGLILLLSHWLVWYRIIVPMTDQLQTSRTTLQQLRDRYVLKTAIIDGARDAIIVIDKASRIIEFNPAAERIFGHRHERIVGQPLVENIIPPALRDTFASGLHQYLQIRLAGRPAQPVEFEAMHADGRVFPVEMAFNELTATDQQLVAVYIRDLTHSKRLETEMARQREALHQSEKMSALGSLLTGVAHELNNPLSIVVGRAIMLEAEAPSPQFARSIAKIRDAAERCARVVKTFIAIARQRPPEPGWICLEEVIEAATEATQQGLHNHEIQLNLEIAPILPKLWADAVQLSQVLMNLIVNAQQAMQDTAGPRQLTIRINLDDKAARVHIHIIDNGCGIPVELRPRIFEPFFTTRGAGVGLGVGLSVSYAIIQSHRGTITLADDAGEGTHFVVSLPVVATHDTA